MESQIIAAEELAPDTGKPVSKLNLGRFGAGFIFFCIVFMMSGTIGRHNEATRIPGLPFTGYYRWKNL